MTYKWIGAVLVVVGCGGFGFSLARETVRQEQLLRDGSEIAAQAEALAHALLTELQRDIRVEQ